MDYGQKVIAGEFALALKWDEAELKEVVEWADSLIATMDTPDDDLIEVSLANNKADAVTALNALSVKADEWEIVLALLQRIARRSSMEPGKASQLARHLYHVAMKPDAPKFMAPFCGHWDDIDLAIDGVYGDVDSSVGAFLADLKEAAQKSLN